MQFLPCLLCSEKLERRTDKNGKPYFVCNPCGIQLFVRRPNGIVLLNKLLADAARNEIPFKHRAEEVYKIQALLSEINGVKQQIVRLQSQIKLLIPGRRQGSCLQLIENKA